MFTKADQIQQGLREILTRLARAFESVYKTTAELPPPLPTQSKGVTNANVNSMNAAAGDSVIKQHPLGLRSGAPEEPLIDPAKVENMDPNEMSPELKREYVLRYGKEPSPKPAPKPTPF